MPTIRLLEFRRTGENRFEVRETGSDKLLISVSFHGLYKRAADGNKQAIAYAVMQQLQEIAGVAQAERRREDLNKDGLE